MSAAWLIVITQIKKKPQNEKSVKTLKPEKETKIRGHMKFYDFDLTSRVNDRLLSDECKTF